MSAKILLVGDNPFHGVSHLSQERVRARDEKIVDPAWAAEIVKTSIENGANGFMFSVSETTLAIIKRFDHPHLNLRYYAIVPAAGDYVRLSSKLGTVGLVKYVAGQIIKSGNFAATINGTKGVLLNDVNSLLKAYLGYEISRINHALNNGHKLYSLMLHELMTEMAIALDMDWIIRTHIEFLKDHGIKPGLETRNFQCLVNKLSKWGINTSDIVITAPFNKLGYQMSPSKVECEQSLKSLPEAEVIAMSVLASGRLKLSEAQDYLNYIPELKGAVIGTSSREQAKETFGFFRRE